MELDLAGLDNFWSTSEFAPHLPPPDCDTTFDEQEAIAAEAASALEAEGWSVNTTGTLVFTHGHMFGNNPESVYGLFLLPELPLWAMSPADAILWVGCTPPPLEYFSMRSYLFGQANDFHFLKNATDEFASLGDAANNLRFNSSGGSKSPGNYNATTSMIVSADRASAAAVTGALENAGFPAGAVNYDWMPSEMLDMRRPLAGVPIMESYIFLFRVSIFHDDDEGLRYVNSSWPVRLLHAPHRFAKDPAPVPVQRARGTGTDEEWLRASVDDLVLQTESYWSDNGAEKLREVGLYPIDIEGILDCVPNRTACGGDNRDAAYFSDYDAYFMLPDDGENFLLVQGVNHNMSGKATYGNVVVEAVNVSEGVFNMSCDGKVGINSRHFAGTATTFAPDVENVASLFAFVIARNCTAMRDFVTPGPGELGCMQVEADMLRRHDTLRIVTRAYLEVETTTGPSYDELVWPRVSEFKFNSHE